MKFDINTINIAVELFGIIICMTVILCRNFLVGSSRKKLQTSFTLLVLCEALILFFSAMSGILMGQRTADAELLLPVCCFFRYFFDCIIMGLFTEYITLCIGLENKRHVRAITWGLIAISAAALTFNLIFPFYYTFNYANILIRGSLFIFSQLPYILICLENIVLVVLHKDAIPDFIFISLLLYITIPALALAAQIRFFKIDLVNIALIIILMYMFVVMQNQIAKDYIAQKKLLQESRTKLMMSQIKPHFLFNSLTSIAQLCDDDPALAKSATIAFANYLRGNLSSIEQTEAIPFKDELNHIKNYLSIECTRFGELLNVEYNIETADFKVPALSIQPIVENAVKHGVGMKENGGTVSVSSRQTDSFIILCIQDDGAGFDIAAELTDSNHIGIRSSRKRLKEMCNADMLIESAPGSGTAVTITIPVIKQQKEGDA